MHGLSSRVDRLRPAAEAEAPELAVGSPVGNGGNLAELKAIAGLTTGSAAPLTWSWPGAALAIGQWDGERDAEFRTDAPGDVPVAGQVFGHQDVARGEPSRAPVSRLKFRQSDRLTTY